MNRISTLVAVVALLVLAACTEAGPPTTAGEATGSPDTRPPDAQLCDVASPTSLPALANQLQQLRASDTRPISEALDVARANIEDLEVEDSAQESREAALGAIDDLQGVIDDRDAREEAASDAADAMLALQRDLCP